jgi:hypothetical protein
VIWNNDIVNDPKKVSEIFNDFFINVAKNIGNPNTVIDENHPSIQAIKTNKPVAFYIQFVYLFIDKSWCDRFEC